MGSWIAFLLFSLLAAADTIFAVKLLGKNPWHFLLAGNAVTPDGSRLYAMEQWQRAAGIFCAVYAGAFAVAAVMTAVTQLGGLLSDSFMAATLYIHGGVLVLGAAAFLAYVDTACQNVSAYAKVLSEEETPFLEEETV
ncbi:MAG: hypothetical protein ACI4XB_03640 [Ruminococcus sp.]